ncbi:bifunctional aspartate transaminase/aspartate 4-decarboxylase [Curtobacterium sp. A7_M15]|uniref:bifunctional aspartate transaminase/aspartate 4-decarboxylase n=1 Tax=Curtobacterium sp. A7_M15 TaxID=3065241 RepID=UPI00273782A5|nr:bifunctional aspartate transaminase/aspartate 4-decarboxylase [Curtobacterium sp. A7_M15]MDP4331996.1 bifunctional aspartate transaminase/aspartate 4-decarboxylase [Curtobacterium sp. A7_M15]
MPIASVSRDQIARFETLSPFELKAELQQIAGEHESRTAFQMLNAGRGNPNFIAPTPRAAFFALGQFALTVSRENAEWDPELIGVPEKDGIADRFDTWLTEHDGEPGIDLLQRTLRYGVDELGFTPDSFVWELADSIMGDHYPEPDRMLHHTEQIVHRYLVQEMCNRIEPDSPYDLFAVEGGTAAMCYIFDTLLENRLMHKGDKVALMTPIFTPYLEIPELDDYAFDVTHLHATAVDANGVHLWQYPDEELEKLRDPSIRAVFVVNPTNPPSVRIAEETLTAIADIVRTDNPNLVIVTDDVYGTFIDGFRSLLSEIPRNTIGVYSYSKYFGATGWRLGVIAVNQDNIFDEQLAALPEDDLAALDRRYGSLSLNPRAIKFVDRLVADSRSVALNHTAGLSLPQQCMMLLFSAYALLDTDDHYKHETQGLIQRRLRLLLDGAQVELPEDPNRVGYYIELDMLSYAERLWGPELSQYLQDTYEPTDILFRLADQTGIILLNGGGFEGPAWSVRVSLANLRDDDYVQIGKSLRAVGMQYLDEWKRSNASLTQPMVIPADEQP